MNDLYRQRRGRVQFLLLATLFFAPLLAAFVLYFYAPELRPQGTTNYGELVTPARPLPPLQLVDADGKPAGEGAVRGKWSLLYVGAVDCDAACDERLITVRQSRLALNEKRERVRRIYVAPDLAALNAVKTRDAAQHPDMLWLADTAAPGARLADFLEAKDAGAIYLLDPLGNWLMVYRSGRPVQDDFKGLQKDIKKLLRLSQIG